MVPRGSLTVSGKPLYNTSIKIVSIKWLLNLPIGRDSFKNLPRSKKRDSSKNETGRMFDKRDSFGKTRLGNETRRKTRLVECLINETRLGNKNNQKTKMIQPDSFVRGGY